MHAINARGRSSLWGGPERKGNGAKRPAGRREGAGGASEGLGAAAGGAGLPSRGGARSSACFPSRPGAAGGGRSAPRLGLARRQGSLPGREAADCRAGAHVGGGLCQMLSLSWWPRETPAPGPSLAAAGNKEGDGRSGRQEARPASAATWSRVSGGAPRAVPRPPWRRPPPKPSGRRGRSGPVLGAAGPGKRAARAFPTWFRGIGRAAGSGEPTVRGPGGRAPAAGTRSPGAPPARPPRGRVRDTDWRPRGPQRAVLPRGIRPF